MHKQFATYYLSWIESLATIKFADFDEYLPVWQSKITKLRDANGGSHPSQVRIKP